MSIQAYVNFNGNCREAVEFYAEVFNTDKPQIMLYGDVPSNEDFPISDETKNLVMHTFLNVKGGMVMFSDVPPEMPFIAGNNISLIINFKDKGDLKATFDKLKAGGSIGMDLQETFWSKCYGFITDKFGIGWQFNLEDK